MDAELTLLVLRHHGREYALTTVATGLRAKARRRRPRWTFATGRRGARVAGRIEAPAAAFVLLEYGNPPGGVKYCLNTKLARCELTSPTGGPAAGGR